MEATIPKTRTSSAAVNILSAEERRAEVERRLEEAADVLAETLLDMWRKEQRSRRAAAHGGTS